MQQLSSIANVQNLPRSDASQEQPPSSKSEGEAVEFVLQTQQPRDEDPREQSELESVISPPLEEPEPSDVDVVVSPLQLELYEFQQVEDVLPAAESSEAVDLLLPDTDILRGVANEPLQPIQPDASFVEPTLPVDRARQLIEIATAAGTLNSADNAGQAEVETSSVSSSELQVVQGVATEFNEGQISDQSQSSLFSANPTSPMADAEPQLAIQSPEVVKNVTSTVAENLVQQVELTENGADRKLIVQLHPAELGQVVLQVDWENETLKAKILTNELAANELLNQNKQQLVAALAENGISFDSLDVAYQDTPNEHAGEQDSVQLPNGGDAAEHETAAAAVTLPTSTTTMVDIVV